MIKIYQEHEKGREKVFFSIGENGIRNIVIGNRAVPTEQGIQFYVEDYVAEQIEKCELYLDGLVPKLKLKDGEIMEVPSDEEEKEEEIEELEKRLRQLKKR